MKHFYAFILVAIFCSFQSVTGQSSERVSPKLFYSLMQKHPDAVVLDTRPSEKYEQYRIKNAIPVPDKAALLKQVKLVSKDDTILVYCEKELRSGPAAKTLDSLGFRHIYELKGGLISWRRSGLPLETTKP